MNSVLRRLPPIATLGPFIALVLACAFFATQSDRFLRTENFALILQQVMVVGVIAIGQTLIILTAGIDLSCGMVMALGSIVMTRVAADYGLPAPLAIACGVAVTAAFGLVNGLLVTRVKLPSFIVTLGTLNIAFAITQLYSKSQTVTDVPAGMTWLGNTLHLGNAEVAYGSLLMLLLYGAVWFYLRETQAGRHIYAVGNNPEATRLTGIADRTRAARRLRARRRALRHRVAAVGGAHRGRRPERRADRQPRLDHRGRARRHQPVRRPRPRAQHAGRRGDRRRAAQRPHADGRAVRLPGPDHRHPGHPRGGRRPTLAQGRPAEPERWHRVS